MTTTNESREAMEPVAWMDEEHGWVTLDHLRACKWKITVGVKVEPLVRAKDAAAKLATVEASVRELEAELEAWRFTNRIDQLERDFEDRGKRIASLEAELAAAKSGGEWQRFDALYAKACETSQPDAWMEAALQAQRIRHAMLPAAPKKED